LAGNSNIAFEIHILIRDSYLAGWNRFIALFSIINASLNFVNQLILIYTKCHKMVQVLKRKYVGFICRRVKVRALEQDASNFKNTMKNVH
jgi:hypothetical protein